MGGKITLGADRVEGPIGYGAAVPLSAGPACQGVDVNKRRLIHWSTRGPAAASDHDQASHPAVRYVTAETATRIRRLLPVLARATNREIPP